MLSVLFWNLRGNQTDTWAVRAPNLQNCLTRLAGKLDIDVFLFAEVEFTAVDVTHALNAAGSAMYRAPDVPGRRIPLFTRLPAGSVIDRFNHASGRLTISEVLTASGVKVLLGALHHQSQAVWDSEEQALHATVLARDMVRTEDVAGHRRTVLVGDFNMNPFDLGVIAAHTLNAVMDRDIARAEERTVGGEVYRFFYNPMWGCFGDRTPGPQGSYFYQASSPASYYWHVFDQVLLRPALMDSLTELRILDHDGEESLLSDRRRPFAARFSDHLPLLFRLDV